MSVEYKPVLWSARKKRYDWIMGGLMLLFLILFVAFQLVFFSQISAETLIIRATGLLALLMIHVILVIGPLCRLDHRFLPLLYNRRHLGVATFFIALIHGIFNIIMFHTAGDTNALLSIFVANEHYNSIGNFPFQVLGFFALLIFFVMAATSHDFWLKNLSPRVWKGLHMSVYVAYALIIAHVLLGTFQREGSLLMLGGLLFGVLLVAGLHMLSASRSHLPNVLGNLGAPDGFHKVCAVDEIEENRAKVVLLEGQNIAIFRYENKCSAVHNLCKHQNGPLGEGKIVDGCITCPWHGYQYEPHNGCSPPPFNEKVQTYDVKIVDGQVYVNPSPYAEGSERPPALIS
ncbi:MAG: Rieske 2Fe-2S domain-containing protein [Bacteroidota bacterium]